VATRTGRSARTSPPISAQAVLNWLERRGNQRNRDGMARYGIRSAKTFGVSMATMRPFVRRLGRDHDLALALWGTGWLEARIVAALVDEPARVTRTQMEAWARAFDNWAVCDGACCQLFVYTPYAWPTVPRWSLRRGEFVRRAAFSMLAGLAVHDRAAEDEQFIAALPLIDIAADDERNFVKKAVNWALRQVGKRNVALNAQAIAMAHRLSARPEASARWIGRDALRELTSSAVIARLAKSSARRR
jgi:3-methyladenine DNA glycosylase AlkD